MARRLALMAVVAFLLTPLSSVRAQFGGGTQIVFDPSMFARQLQQLQQETQTVLTEAQQLQYMIRNTTGGYAGVWQSSQSMLDELGGIIQQQGGLSYTLSNLQSQFQQQFPGYTVPSESGPTGSQKHRHHVEHPQRHSGGSPSASAKFCQRAGAIWRARRYEQDRCGKFAGNRGGQRNRLAAGAADSDAEAVGRRHDQRAERRRRQCSQSRRGRRRQHPTVA